MKKENYFKGKIRTIKSPNGGIDVSFNFPGNTSIPYTEDLNDATNWLLKTYPDIHTFVLPGLLEELCALTIQIGMTSYINAKKAEIGETLFATLVFIVDEYEEFLLKELKEHLSIWTFHRVSSRSNNTISSAPTIEEIHSELGAELFDDVYLEMMDLKYSHIKILQALQEVISKLDKSYEYTVEGLNTEVLQWLEYDASH